MISKETFCKALRLIEEQDKTNQKFSDALWTVPPRTDNRKKRPPVVE